MHYAQATQGEHFRETIMRPPPPASVGAPCLPHQGGVVDSPKSIRFTGAMSSSYSPIVFCIDHAKKSSRKAFRAGGCFAEAQLGQRQGASDPGRFSRVYQDR